MTTVPRRILPLSTLCVLAAFGSVACGSSEPTHGATSSGNGSEDAGGGGNANTTDSGGTNTGTDAATGPCGVGKPSGFMGDDQCLPVPGVDEGLQLHVGPTSYDDPDVINAQDANGKYLWLMEPGDERTQCYHILTPNTEGRYYFKQQYRMRPGSHHMIIQGSSNTSTTEGWGPCTSSILGAIGGTQRGTEDLPPGGIVAPEDEGLGRGMDPATPLDIQLHFYNRYEETTLREVWVNFLYKPKEEVTTNLGMLGGFTRMNVAPHTQATVGNVCKAEQAIPATDPVRVVTLFGHAHTHNKRFVVYHDKADGTNEVVYDSYDGAEAPTYTYSTTAENPVADADNHISGAKSGLLLLKPGEQLRYSCDIDNNTDFTFVGKNEVETDEMCNLFGSVAGLGFPCFTLPSSGVKPPAMP